MPTIRRRPKTPRSLMKHQTEGLRDSLRRKHAALFMEMRLGKTLLCIRWAKRLRVHCVLILAPVTVLEAWERELWREGERFITCYGLSARKRNAAIEKAWESDTRTWVLMNYEGLLSLGETYMRGGKRKRKVPEVARLPWDLVALDESTKIKNPLSQITNVCLQGFRSARHRAILTGLPNPEGDLDLVCQFLFLHGVFLGCRSYWEVRQRYFYKAGFRWKPKRGTAALIKKAVHSLAFVKTAEQAGMPVDVVYEVRHVNMNPAQRKLYNQIVKEYAATLNSGKRVETKWILTQRTWLQKLVGGFDPENGLVCGNIANEIVELLKTELANKKVVIWFRFRHELEYMRERLTRAKISHVHLVGGEGLTVRRTRLKQFRDRSRVLLATEKVAKFGVDCSDADTALYYSNEWGNEDRQQSLKRVVHPKKKRTHLIVDFAVRGTISEEVIKAVNEKGLKSADVMSIVETKIRGKKAPEPKPRPTIKRRRHAHA